MLEVRDLHVKFHNRDREAVAGVNFKLNDGEILGLVGALSSMTERSWALWASLDRENPSQR